MTCCASPKMTTAFQVQTAAGNSSLKGPDRLGWNQSCYHYTRDAYLSAEVSRFRNCGGWNRTNIRAFRAPRPTVRRPRINRSRHADLDKVRGGGVEPPLPGSKPGGLPLADPRSKECPAGVEPASPGWKPGTSAARPRAHRITSVRTVGFEPTISCSRGTRNTRLSYILNLFAARGKVPKPLEELCVSQDSGLPRRKSAQRESNPHIRHGKATGWPLHHGRLRYVSSCQGSRAPGGSRTHVPALRGRNLRR